MSKIGLIALIFMYLGILFLIAFFAEKNKGSKLVTHPAVYALSLAVYCSAWTYYGSVGMAARTGVEFLTIYLGPIIAAPLWIIILKKIIQLSKVYNVSSIADFISLRYGNSRSLGALVTIVCAVSIIPYISLQLKAISETFEIVSTSTLGIEGSSVITDSTFYIAIILAVFASFFGTLSLDASKQRAGVMFSVAAESVLKLTFFLIVGIYVTYYVFNGTSDLYQQASLNLDLNQLSTINGLSGGINWYFSLALSFLAIFLLPRQFQTSVVEFNNRKQLKTSIWLFPLYLLLFNLFVIFIAWGGLLILGKDINADYFTLLIPLHFGDHWLAIIVFLGGLSAVISMVVVSTVALSTMLSNNLIIPYGFIKTLTKRKSLNNEKIIKNIRRVSVFCSIILAYLLYALFNPEISLFSIGLISFLIIVQLAPSFFIGMFWNRGSALGAKAGIVIGMLIVVFTYLLPFFTENIFSNNQFVANGLFGITALKPYALFGIELLNPVNHALYWSLLLNTGAYLILSVIKKGNYRERNYGEMFVNTSKAVELKENAYVWKGEAYVEDIQNILVRFLGQSKADKALRVFRKRYAVNPEDRLADARFINFSERLLTGAVGSASAKILISNVAKEKPVSLVEVLHILEENRETISVNKSLEAQSQKLIKLASELKSANEELKIQDQLKDDFLDTVAHELKTPITSIKASSEVLTEGNDMPEELQQRFLSNIIQDTERLNVLINDILDLEKMASGRDELTLEYQSLNSCIEDAINGIRSIAGRKNIQVEFNAKKKVFTEFDYSKMLQVFTNLLSNAIKFVPENYGIISVSLEENSEEISCKVIDNGKGIPEEDIQLIFKKFYQSKNQTFKKPIGSGFGLAICKQIVEMHKGKIYAESNLTTGAEMNLKLPKQNT
ncbi:sensor histidine kinase [Psychroflexus montanilacus]|uniref:sensor histidine kinase n=1 Tax=Psychroflexus montanilacus TaxID=2873598 RepID=UPI001CCC3867|nr:sensor histidine kinase [Psychroflexus montanilacus]MBZ9653019.1 sensor histidine kinase [Psychroflexus montanilacus]